jgi:hypothetical protein
VGAERRTVCADAALEIANLSQRGVLAAGAQQVAERAAVDAAVAALVEELERFAVVCRGLVAVIHGCSGCRVKRERGGGGAGAGVEGCGAVR